MRRPHAVLLVAMVLSGLLAASAPPVVGFGPCAEVRVMGFVHASTGANGHPHYQVGTGHPITLSATGAGGKSLSFETSTDIQSGLAHYKFALPQGGSGVELGDTLVASASTPHHEGASPARVVTAADGCDINLDTIQWVNLPPVTHLGVIPPGPDVDDALSGSLGFEDPNNDAATSVSWAWLMCDPEDSGGTDCSVDTNFAGDPALQGSKDSPTSPFAGFSTVPAAKTKAGQYWRLQAILTDEHGAGGNGQVVVTRTVRVAAPGDLPTASFTVSPQAKQLAGDAFDFDASASALGPNNPSGTLSHLWEFGDDAKGTGATTTHPYALGGVFTVRLTVQDDRSYTDEADAVVFVNRPPTATASLPDTVTRGADVLGAGDVSDPDNEDTEPGNNDPSLTRTYLWQAGAGGCSGTSTTLRTLTGSTALSDTLPATLVPPKGDCLLLTVTPDDGLEAGDSTTTTGVVANAPPQLGAVTLGPAAPRTTDDLTASAAASDADADAVECRFEWIRAGAEPILTGPRPCGEGRLDQAETGKGQTWTVRVTPSDEEDSGTPATSDPITILNSPPSPPDLVSPLDGAASVDPEPDVEFAWTAAADKDDDGLQYTIVLDTQSPPLAALSPVSTTSLEKANLEPSTQYYWQVVASDGTDTAASEIFSFQTINIPSFPGTIASLEFSEAPAWSRSSTGTFTWGEATNPDGAAIVGYTVAMDGDPSTEATEAQPATTFAVTLPLAEGAHVFKVRAINDEGQAGPIRSYGFQVDTVAPVTAATLDGTPGQSGWFRSAVTVTLAAADATSGPATTSYRVDGGPVQPYSMPFPVSGEGSHDVKFWSADTAGNEEPDPAVSFKVDSVPPTVSLLAQCSAPGSAGWCRAASASYTGAASDAAPGSGLADGQPVCTLDGASAACSGSVTAEGLHPVALSATDAAGNTATATVDLLVDRTAPAVTLTAARAPDANGWYRQPVSFTLTGTDAASGVASCAADPTYAGPDAATASVAGSCTDVAGNSNSGSVTFKYDGSAPSVTLTAPAFVGATGGQVGATASDGVGSGVDGVDVEVRRNGGAWQRAAVVAGQGAIPSSRAHGDLLEFHGLASDVAGNQGTFPATPQASTRVDTAPPAAPTDLKVLPAVGGTFNLLWTAPAADAGAPIASYKIFGRAAGGSFAEAGTATGPSGSPSTVGVHGTTYGFQVSAVDGAGNEGPRSAVASAVADAEAPRAPRDVAVTGPATNGFLRSHDLRVSWSPVSDAALYQIQLDGALVAQTSNASVSGDFGREGTLSFRVLALDAAGNSAASAPVSVTVDTLPPTSALTAPEASGENSFSLQFEASDATSGVARVDLHVSANGGPFQLFHSAATTTGTVPFTGAQGTRYAFASVATDRAGNAAALPAAPEAASTILDRHAEVAKGGAGGGAAVVLVGGSAEVPEGSTELRVEVNGRSVQVLVVRFQRPVQGATLTFVEDPSALDAGLTAAADAIGEVFAYFVVDLPALADDVDGAWFEFHVENAWIESTGSLPDELFVHRFQNGRWVLLPTRLLGVEGTRHVFEAWTPGFSTFAIMSVDTTTAAGRAGEAAGGGEGSEFLGIVLAGIAIVFGPVVVSAVGAVVKRRRRKRLFRPAARAVVVRSGPASSRTVQAGRTLSGRR